MGSRKRKGGRPAARPSPAGRTRADASDRPAGPTQKERIATQRRVRRQRATRNRLLLAGVVVVAAGALTLNIVNHRRHNRQLVAAMTAGSCRFDGHADSGSAHVTNPTYRVN